ncbi:MAG: hypothetical protein ACOYLB_07460 [Phototrophicaceae bacterium]
MSLLFSAYIYRWLTLQVPADTLSSETRLMIQHGFLETLRTHWQLVLVRFMGGLVVTGWVGYVAGFGMQLVYTFLCGLIVALILHVLSTYAQTTEALEQSFTHWLIATLAMNAVALVAFTILFIVLQTSGLSLSTIPRLMLGYGLGLVVGHGKTDSFNWIGSMIMALVASMLVATQYNASLSYMIFPLFIFSTGLLLSLGILNWEWIHPFTQQHSPIITRSRLLIVGGYGLLIGLIAFSGLLFFAGGAWGTLGAMMSGVLGGGLVVWMTPQQVSNQASDVSSLKLSETFLVTGLIMLGVVWVSLGLNASYGLAIAVVGLLSIPLLLAIHDTVALNSLSQLQMCVTGLNALALSLSFLHTSQLITSDGLMLSVTGLSKIIVGFVMGGVFIGWMIIHVINHAPTAKADGWFIQLELIWTAFPSILTLLIALGAGNILGDIVGKETVLGVILGISLVGWIITMAIDLPTLPHQMMLKVLQRMPLLVVILSFSFP